MTDKITPQSQSQPGNAEVQRLQREATKSKPGSTPGADIPEDDDPGTEDVNI